MILTGSLFALIATLYSSVGHAGASGYLAIMALLSFQPEIIKPTSLVLNIVVAAIASYNFIRNGYFDKKIFFPLIITSIPAAFLGGYFQLSPEYFKIFAGIFLICSALLLVGKQFLKPQAELVRKVPYSMSILAGAVIGFISGLIGVGGGIFLSPLLILTNWSDVKKTSGIAALFILVNSIAGLAGHVISFKSFDPNIFYWIVAVSVGGAAGSYLGTMKFDKKIITLCLFLILLSAGVKFIVTSM